MHKHNKQDPQRQARLEQWNSVCLFFNKPCFEATSWYQESLPVNDTDRDVNHKPRIEIINDDVLAVARNLRNAFPDAPSIAILNLGSQYKPGGGVRTGSLAQEESLFLRTDLRRFLDVSHYPLDDKVAFSPHVAVHEMRIGVELHQKPQPLFHVDVITAALMKDPKVKSGSYGEAFAYQDDMEFTQNVIDGIFEVAARHKCRHLVLGALGCGAYHNPVDAVLECFQTALKNYGYLFDVIQFAIKGRPGAGSPLCELGRQFQAALVK
jgi:uncharacterized protein (TIGR02452 family)